MEVSMTSRKHRFALLALALLALLEDRPAFAADVVRHKIPNSDFPIALAVEVPAGKKLVFLSGDGPTVVNKSAKPDTIAAFGDTKTQAASTLASIKATLKSLKLDMKDVVKMTVFLAGDPAKGGKMDFEGLMQAYGAHFGGKEQPNLPARSTVMVAGLVNPGWLVEIEVVAVAPD
jgi:enamine deaminase RidA (YjgF/YER057c/UK114 family)